jgi:ATP adenylyltransferase
MVVPNRHIGNLSAASPEERHELMEVAARCERALDAVYHPEGFNLGLNLGRSAGAGIADHIHLHLVPRWGGDTNFMTVLGETRLIPEDLDRTWSRLKEALDPTEGD